MKAALLEAFDTMPRFCEVDDPKCPTDGVVIAIRACGVCRSDHHAWKGHDSKITLPHIMGHELAGDVIEVGPECKGFKLGERVTVPFIIACGHCPDCRSGNPTICDHQDVIGFTFWGAYAERVAIPHADFNLVPLPECLGYVEAAGMGCRVTTAWRGLVDRAGVKPGEWVSIHGSGGVGLSAILIASALGARVLATDVSDAALELAKEMGANAVLNVSGLNDVGAAVREMTDGGSSVSVDALGISATFENSLRSLRKLGRHVQIGMPVAAHQTVPLPLLELVYSRQLTIHGMRGLGASQFGPLMDMIAAGRLDVGKLVTKRIKLSEVGAALKAMDGHQPAGVTVIDRLDA